MATADEATALPGVPDPSKAFRMWMRDLTAPALILSVLGLAFNAGMVYSRIQAQDEKLRTLEPMPAAIARIDQNLQDMKDAMLLMQQQAADNGDEPPRRNRGNK